VNRYSCGKLILPPVIYSKPFRRQYQQIARILVMAKRNQYRQSFLNKLQ
jgi:hypothetical protein